MILFRILVRHRRDALTPNKCHVKRYKFKKKPRLGTKLLLVKNSKRENPI